MSSELIKKSSKSGQEVEVLGPTYDPGKPKEKDDWRAKLGDRQQRLKYLQSGERYWYSEDWYGSERRKTPA